jgi:hypothetical protein
MSPEQPGDNQMGRISNLWIDEAQIHRQYTELTHLIEGIVMDCSDAVHDRWIELLGKPLLDAMSEFYDKRDYVTQIYRYKRHQPATLTE